MNNNPITEYWMWFFRGSGGRAGYSRLLNRWLLFHIIIGLIMVFLVPLKLEEAANAVLLPLVGIMVGLSFAWAGNAQALLQSSEIEELSQHHPGGFIEYVYVYQTAILTILITVVAWATAGLSVFDKQWPTCSYPEMYFAIETFLFALSSATLRECWHVVMGAQWMLLIQREIKRSKKK